MPRLMGFSKTKSSSDSDNQLVNLMEKSYLNKTEYGEFNTVEEIQGLIDQYSKLPSSMNVETKKADLVNKQLQITAKLNDVLNSKENFDSDLQAALLKSGGNNFKDIRNFIGSYASIYNDAADRFDSEITSDIIKRYGTKGVVPQDVFNYRDKLKAEAQKYSTLFNSYNVQDPETGKWGGLNPEAYTLKIDTNPSNGNMVRLEIVNSAELDKTKYMPTDLLANVMEGKDENGDDVEGRRLSIALNIFEKGKTTDGKSISGAQLGKYSFEGMADSSKDENYVDTQVGILGAKKEDAGGFFRQLFSESNKETQNKSLDQIKKEGVKFSTGSYNFDGNDIPKNTILKSGNRMFYSTDNGILEIARDSNGDVTNNLTKYLSGIGKDINKVPLYQISSDYLIGDKGTSKVVGKVDDAYFTTPTPDAGSNVFNSSPQSNNVDMSNIKDNALVAPGGNPMSFFNAKNTPNAPDKSTTSSGGATSVNDLIDKGKSFFRNIG